MTKRALTESEEKARERGRIGAGAQKRNKRPRRPVKRGRSLVSVGLPLPFSFDHLFLILRIQSVPREIHRTILGFI